MFSSYEAFSSYISSHANELTSSECKILAGKLLNRAEQKEFEELKEANTNEAMKHHKRLGTHNCNITMINCNRKPTE